MLDYITLQIVYTDEVDENNSDNGEENPISDMISKESMQSLNKRSLSFKIFKTASTRSRTLFTGESAHSNVGKSER